MTIKKSLLLILLLFISIFYACADEKYESSAKSSAHTTVVSGTVTCHGQAVAGAVISDGVEVTETDASGRYTLLSSGKTGYVFISVPKGYKVSCEGVLPRHYMRIHKNKTDNANFELIPMVNNDYTLFVMTDMHLIGSPVHKDIEQFRSTFLPDIVAEIKAIPGEIFSLSLGDMTTDSRWYRDNFSLPEYLKEFRNYPSGIYHIMGNHDNDPNVSGDTENQLDKNASGPYRKYIGPTYYSLNIGEVHYVMLDNIVGLGDCKYKYYIDSVQLAWLRKDLAKVDHSTPLIISMHVPAYKYAGIKEGKLILKKRADTYQDVQVLIDIIKSFKEVHILTGHDHRNRNIQIADNILEHNLVSASAISWKLNDVRTLTIDGTANGYQIFKISGKDISWTYKAVGLAADKSQFRVYDLNTIPTQYYGKPGKNELLVNVFNWDPLWKISATENGNALPVTQVWGKDPLYAYIRDKSKAFANRPKDWRAVNCMHLFNIRTKTSNSDITITVTDRFGRSYVEKVERPKLFTEDMN